jgi:cytoskeletal protein RodZ
MYIHAGDVIPIIGFLLAGSLVFSLYPNKSISLLSGILVAAMLKVSKREGLDPETGMNKTDKVVPETPKPEPVKPSITSSVADTATAISSAASVLGIDSASTTSTPASVTDKKPVGPVPGVTAPVAKPSGVKPNYTVMGNTENSKKEGMASLDPSEFSNTDMDKLSNIIDKTTDLLKMLPEGFLAKTSN